MWLYIPSNSAPAWACSEKDCEPGSDIWASRLAPSATLSGKLTLPASWRRASKKEAWTRLLSGPTCSPSMLERGAAQWIASLQVSPAKTSALQVAVLGSTASARASSSTSSTSRTLAVRGSSFWRTSQASLLPPLPLWTKPAPPTMPPSPLETAFRTWALKMVAYSNARPPESWENWPTAGGTRNGSLFPRPMWAPATAAPDGSALPGEWGTPTVDFKARSERFRAGRTPNLQEQINASNRWLTPAGMAGIDHTGKAGAGGEFAQQATQWMTPNVPNGGRKVPEALVNSKGTTDAGEKKSVGLESQSRYWSSPRASDGKNGGPNQRGSNGDLMLPSMAAQWPTPDAAMHQGGNTSPGPAGFRPNIALAAQQWPTPAARDAKGANSEEHALVTGGGDRKHMDQLANFAAYSPQAQQIRDGQQSSPSTPNSPRHLNPIFGAWLMGWPSAWVIAAPHASSALATASWRSALASQLSSLCGAPEELAP